MDATRITLREWATLHGLNDQTVLRYITEGRVAAQKQGRCWFLQPEAVVSPAAPGRSKVRGKQPRL